MTEAYSRKRRVTQKAAERKLGEALGMLESFGMKFRRQAPKGSNTVDFMSDEAKLVIELDTEREPDERQARYNETRIALLESRGYRFLRFWADDVVRDLAKVTAQIIAVLREQRQRAADAAAAPQHVPNQAEEPGARDLSYRKTALLG